MLSGLVGKSCVPGHPPHPARIAIESSLAGAVESRRRTSQVTEPVGTQEPAALAGPGTLGPSQAATGRLGLVMTFTL